MSGDFHVASKDCVGSLKEAEKKTRSRFRAEKLRVGSGRRWWRFPSETREERDDEMSEVLLVLLFAFLSFLVLGR